jgi:hypothetical protein
MEDEPPWEGATENCAGRRREPDKLLSQQKGKCQGDQKALGFLPFPRKL